MLSFLNAVSLNSLRRAALASFALALPLAAAAQAPTIVSFSPATATPGQTVTIAGTNLNNLKSVLLNGQELVVPLLGATAVSVQFTVPPAAGTGRIRVTTVNGTVVSGQKLGVKRASSSLSFPTSTTPATAMATGNFSTPTMGDLDNDGLIEMLVGQGDGTMMWYEQNAPNSATFGTPGTLLTFNTGGGTIDVGLYAKPTIADLDGNGLQEVIVGEENGTVLRYEQVAATGASALKFGPATTLFANPYGITTTRVANAGSYARPVVTDLDGDDLLDILVGSNDGTLRRYEQTMANTSTTAGFTDMGQVKLADGTILDAGAVSKPLVTDYDGDGKLDMLVGNYAGNIKLYTQTQANSALFIAVNSGATGGILSTSGTDATQINTGNATTNPGSLNQSNLGGYAAPAITDIDGDGVLDLFLGNGNGTMLRFEQTQSATSPTISAPLPVVLTAFAGQVTAAGNHLAWSTAQEVKSASFVVEASADGKEFAAVAELAAAGNSTSARSYEYLDASAAAQAAARRYYRLRQVDLDGTVAYSPVVALSRAAAVAPAIAEAYPNPFTESISVALPGRFEPQAARVQLFTLAGRSVYSTTLALSAAPQALPALPELPAGVYVLRLATATGTTTQKVVRQ